jgi:hypothetical protein
MVARIMETRSGMIEAMGEAEHDKDVLSEPTTD